MNSVELCIRHRLITTTYSITLTYVSAYFLVLTEIYSNVAYIKLVMCLLA